MPEEQEHEEGMSSLTRRKALALGGVATAGALTAGALIVGTSAGAAQEDAQAGAAAAVVGPGEVEVTLRINGTVRPLKVEPRVTLLDALRERLDLTGTKKGCDRGECGACTVLVDGRRVKSCMKLAVMADGQEVTTIEGLADGDRLHPMQQAFIRRDAFQCGFCTSGQIMSAVGMVREGRPRSAAEIRERMSGNLCRCSAYPNIVAAISDVTQGGSA